MIDQQPQQQRPSDVEVEAMLKALSEQRNGAMDQVVRLAAEIALLQNRLGLQQGLIAKMQAEAAKSNIPTGGTP